MRPVAPCAPQVVTAEVKAGRREQLLGAPVVERGPFELEEQQLRLDLGGALLDALQQRAALRVRGVSREPKRGVGTGPTDQLFDLGKLAHRGRQPLSVQLGDLAGIALVEGRGPRDRLVQHPLGAARAVAVDERI